MERQKHLLAALHFKAIYTYLLFIPSIFLTMAGGILSVFAQSGGHNLDSRYTIAIAVLASFSVFWQSLMNKFDYSGRSALHDSAATALAKIYKLGSMSSKAHKTSDSNNDSRNNSANMEAGVPMTSDSSQTKEGSSTPGMSVPEGKVRHEDHNTLTKQYEQALQGCTSSVPIKITAAFNSLESSINVCNKRLLPSDSPMPKISWEKVYPALYHQLTLTIIGSRMWPYVVPGAEWAVRKTIKDFKEQNGCLLDVLVQRNMQIDKEYAGLNAMESDASSSNLKK